MTDRGRGAFSLRIGIALAACLLLFAFPAASQDQDSDNLTGSVAAEAPAPTAGECEHQYGSSAADDTCRNETITPEDGMCRIQAECLGPLTADAGETYYDNDFLGSLYEVVRLSNCGGTLTSGSC